MGPTNDPLTPPPGAPPPVAPPPTPPGDLPVAPAMPPPAPAGMGPVQPEVTQAPGGSSKKPMMIAIIIVLLIAILGVGGFFAFNMMGQPTDDKVVPPTQTEDTTNADVEALNDEVEGIELGDPASDMAEIDSQINAIDASASPSASTL